MGVEVTYIDVLDSARSEKRIAVDLIIASVDSGEERNQLDLLGAANPGISVMSIGHRNRVASFEPDLYKPLKPYSLKEKVLQLKPV